MPERDGVFTAREERLVRVSIETTIKFVLTVALLMSLGAVGGWFGHGAYEDHVAKVTLKRLCEEGIMCGELK